MTLIKKCMLTITALLLTACASTPEPSVQSEEDEELALSLAALFGETIQVDEKTLAQYPLGSKDNPVRVEGPLGQREYLSRLVCDNHEQVSAFQRSGNAGIGPYGNIIDRYEVICDTNQGAVTHNVYLDMYHGSYVETRPAAGFIALKPASKK